MSAHEVDVVLAIAHYGEAVRQLADVSTVAHFESGAYELARVAESNAHADLLMLVAPELARAMAADALVNAAHDAAQRGGLGIPHIDAVHAMVNMAVSR